MEEENSMFLQFFGDSPQFRMIDFLLEHRLEDFTKTEIAAGAGISWASLFNHWGTLAAHGIVKQTRSVGRATLYQLDETNKIVKQLRAIELALIKEGAQVEEERVELKAKVSNKRQKN